MNKLIIINGNYRSGTTFIQKKLDNLENFEILMQPCFFIFKLFENELREKLNIKTFKNFPTGLFFSKKIFKIKPQDLEIKVSKINFFLNKLLKINNKNKIFYFTKKNFYKILYYEINNQSKKKISIDFFLKILSKTIYLYRKQFNLNKKILYIGFKEGYLTTLLPILLKIKELFIINLIRDPREIACSRNYSEKKNFIDFDTSKKHPTIMIALLCKNNMLMDFNLKKRKNYLSLQFQDLFSKKKNILKTILNFLKIRSFKSNKKIMNKETRSEWKINTSNVKSKRFPLGNYWKNKLTIEEIAVLENICSKEMQIFKYKKHLSKKNALTLSKNFREKEKKLKPWTNKLIFKKITDKLNTLQSNL